MPKIYNDATLSLVWDMITEEKLMLREVAKQLDTDVQKVNQMFKAAYRRFGCNQHSNRKRAVAPVKKIKQMPVTKRERPPAVYSNISYQHFLAQ